MALWSAIDGPNDLFAQQAAASQVLLTAVDDTAYTFKDIPVDVDVLTNDLSSSGGAEVEKIILSILVQPLHGTATIDRNDTPADGNDDFIRYVPDPGYEGPDSLTYNAVDDSSPNDPDEAVVRIWMNRLPMASEDRIIVPPGVTTLIDVLENDTDPDGDSLIVEGIALQPGNGTAKDSLQAGQRVKVAYTPNPGYVGPDTLRYVLFDMKNGRDTTNVFITSNSVPVAQNDTTHTTPSTTVTVDVLQNDSDPDGHDIEVELVSQAPGHGSAEIAGNLIRYTPSAGFDGIDSFEYTVKDELDGRTTARVVIDVNTPPNAVDDSAEGFIDTTIDVMVLDNDSDPKGDPLVLEAIVMQPRHGSATIDQNGTPSDGTDDFIRYEPNAGFFGSDSLRYSIFDGRTGRDEAYVLIEVLADAVVQFINNGVNTGTVDIYAHDERVVNDLAFREATPYIAVPAGETVVEYTAGNALNNNSPLATTTVTLEPGVAYIIVGSGDISGGASDFAGQALSLHVRGNARTTASNNVFVELLFVHGAPDAPGLDIRQLDPNNSNLPSATLVDDLSYGSFDDYFQMVGLLANIDAASADGQTQFEAFRFDLRGLQGKTLTVVASGLLNPGDASSAFALIGFDANGNEIDVDLATSAEESDELPTEFALRGNYPNPFNPATTLLFDLPETASVSIEIIDLMGRSVMLLPAQVMKAGANQKVQVDASRLASGTYLYRVKAQTATDTLIETGRMMLVK